MASPQIISLNQIIGFFELFADQHPSFNDFGYGPTSEIGTTRQMNFPYLWTTHRVPSSISLLNKTQIPTYNFSFLIVDRINQQQNYKDAVGLNSDNQQETVSDCKQLADDFLIYIQNNLKDVGLTIDNQDITLEMLFDETPDKVTGVVFDVAVKTKHINCITPFSGITLTAATNCPKVTVQNSDGTFSQTINAGGILTIPDTTITINTAAFSGYPSSVSHNIIVKDTSGTEVGSKVGEIWEVPSSGDSKVNRANPTKHGAGDLNSGVPFFTNDAIDQDRGRGTDFFTLPQNNPFGNTDRFTDVSGTTAYTNDVVIDWTSHNQVGNTVLGYFRIPVTATFFTTMLAGQPYTRASLSNWFVTNLNEGNAIMYRGIFRNPFNYSPFNIDITATTDRLWSNYTDNGAGAWRWASTTLSPIGLTANQRAVLVRIYTLAELGL